MGESVVRVSCKQLYNHTYTMINDEGGFYFISSGNVRNRKQESTQTSGRDSRVVRGSTLEEDEAVPWQ